LTTTDIKVKPKLSKYQFWCHLW